MEVLKILSLKHSGIGRNALHSQLINIIRKYGYGIELHNWCVKNNIGATHNKEISIVSVGGTDKYSFQCSLLVK